MERKRILIVEDEILVAESIRSRLEKNGYAVTSIACSGEKAIEKAEADNPDLVLMDITLGDGMDGVEAAGRISERTGTPVVFLTAHSDDETLKRAKISGPYAYITKPFEERQLLIAIEISLYKDAIEKEKERLIEDLRHALDEIRTLRGIIPICAHCKMVRDDEGYWRQVEEYFNSRTEVEFSHSICPDCIDKYYPEYKPDEQ